MTEPDTMRHADDVPPVTIETKRGISMVWLIPIIAAIVGLWLAYVTISEQGPLITITFNSADGLEAEKTKLKFKDVEVGHLESVELSKDLSHIIVQARMVKHAEPYLTDGTQFWVVRPRIGARGVSGLGTLLSGAYIGLHPGEGAVTHTFTGLEDPPPISSDVAGKFYTLHTMARGSLNIGSPIYFRNFDVGQITALNLLDNGQSVVLDFFIRDPYHELVRMNTHFWNASGISVSIDADGARVQMASIETLLAGGIAFETPDDVMPLAEAGHVFVLYDSHEKTSQPLYTRKVPYTLYFEESVRGLDPGAPVEFRGVRVGTVRGIQMEFDTQTAQIRVPVTIEIEPARIPRMEDSHQVATLEETRARIERLVQRGLRAQLHMGNILTGKQFVSMDFYPNTPMTLLDVQSGYPQLPTTPTVMGTVGHAAANLLDTLQKLPLEQIAQHLLGASKGLNHLLNDPELQQTVRSATTTLDAFRTLAEEIDRTIIPSAQQTLAALDERSPVYLSVVETLDQLSATARSLRVFAEYLERHPEALLRGKQ